MRDDIHVVLDSIAISDETELAHDPRCHVLKLSVRHGDVEWRDGEKSLEEMFAMVEKTGELPKTSQPPIGEILELFTSLVQENKKVIAIFLDGVLSGTVETARLAARQVMEAIPGSQIRVFDGLTCGCPLSGMAIAALQKADTGASFEEVAEYTQDVIRRTQTYFTVNTLEYLQKGGRIGAVGALLGNILGIRPIIHTDEGGKLVVADKARTRKKVLNRMLDLISAHAPLEAIFVAHAVAPEDAEYLRSAMAERFPNVPIIKTSIGTVLAAHLGPGVIGVFGRTKA